MKTKTMENENTSHDVRSLAEKLRGDCLLGKYKHFHAADRARRWNAVVGWPAIAIGLFVASGLFIDFFSIEIIRYVGTALSFGAVVLVSLQTFFRFGKIQEGQRSVANRYLSIGRKCEMLLAKLNEQVVSPEQAFPEYSAMLDDYTTVNVEAESFPTSRGDLKFALLLKDTKIT